MLGIILWYNAEKSVGLVWCEDQGPLAYIGPDVAKPEGVLNLERGTHVRFELEETNGLRHVRYIDSIDVLTGLMDPGDLLTSYNGKSQRPALRVVA